MSEALRRPVVSLGATTRSAKPSTRREVTWSTPRRTIHLFNIDAKLVPIKESLELRIEEPPSAEQRGDGNHRQPFIGLRLRARQPRQGLRAGGVDPLPPLPIPQAPELDIQSLRLGLRLGLRLAQLQIITALAHTGGGAPSRLRSFATRRRRRLFSAVGSFNVFPFTMLFGCPMGVPPSVGACFHSFALEDGCLVSAPSRRLHWRLCNKLFVLPRCSASLVQVP